MSTLTDYYFELAQQAINTVGMIPPVPTPPLCASDKAQPEPVGSPHLADWSMDTRPTYKLSDAELLDKGRWQLEAPAQAGSVEAGDAGADDLSGGQMKSNPNVRLRIIRGLTRDLRNAWQLALREHRQRRERECRKVPVVPQVVPQLPSLLRRQA